MIKDKKYLEEFEKEIIRNKKADIANNIRIVEALYKEAVSLGVFPLKNPLEGIEVDIKIAKVINSVSETS
jgi:hypothetical protein